MAAILQTTFFKYSLPKEIFWLNFHFSLLPGVLLTISQMMTWNWTGGKLLLEPMTTQLSDA